ncbi:DUF4488 domain-containing protein [Flavobacterium acetivorans]|uniref:DUF4488 domain-containing protein n=1 Tax=Flavobacterium acetivorans TaxID=2893883 RepID=UPI001E331D58|nr:DUF4488 domain-containing protein [Flavobacterium sp. F-29]UFH35304.1 DUF4488 domain-containing protein [Flavobacterium sp. F-29]
MKKKTLHVLTLIAISSFFLANAQSKINEKSKALEGVWTCKAERSSNLLEMGFRPAMPGTLKIISADGKFTNIRVMQSKTVITIDGLFKVESDSIFVESIKRSLNSVLIGKENRLLFRMEGNNKLYIKWFLEKNQLNQKMNIWIEELWEKAEMPSI